MGIIKSGKKVSKRIQMLEQQYERRPSLTDGENDQWDTVPANIIAYPTTTLGTAVWYANQRQCYYANGRYWVWYVDSDRILYYRTSLTGRSGSWSSAIAIVYTGATTSTTFSLFFDGVYVSYARALNKILYYRRGIPEADGTITWSQTEQTALTSPDALIEVHISADSNGYPFIGYYTTTPYKTYIIKSSTNNGVWTTQSAFPYLLNESGELYHSCIPVSLLNGKMYVVYSHQDETLKGRLWSGSSWGSIEVVSTKYVRRLDLNRSYSVTSRDNEVHLTFTEKTTYDHYYIRRVYGTGWETEVLIQTGLTGNSASVISIKNNGTVFSFWKGSPVTDEIYYKRRLAGVWDTDPTVWTIEDGYIPPAYQLLTCFFKAYDNRISLVYMARAAPPSYVWQLKIISLEKQ